ncbi:MAG: hypothetical protein GC157_16290 [Frankiales bacterium]|nr:hypothetical protein [Frankiales bacterium]
MILCCAGPALIASGAAAGALAVLGGWLANSWGIGLAAVAALFVIVGLVRRNRSGRTDDCCSPAAPSLDDSTTPGHTQEQEG